MFGCGRFVLFAILFILELQSQTHVFAKQINRIAVCIGQLPRPGGSELADLSWPWSAASMLRNDSDTEISLFVFHQAPSNDTATMDAVIARITPLKPTRFLVVPTPSAEEMLKFMRPGVEASGLGAYCTKARPAVSMLCDVGGWSSNLSEVFLRWRSFEMMRKYESDHGMRFTHVVSVRSELRFLMPLPAVRRWAARPNTLWVMFNNPWGGLNSNVALMPRHIADVFMAQVLDEMSSGVVTQVGRAALLARNAEELMMSVMQAAASAHSNADWSICHLPAVGTLQCCDREASAAIGEKCTWSTECVEGSKVNESWATQVNEYMQQIGRADLTVQAGQAARGKAKVSLATVDKQFHNDAIWYELVGNAPLPCYSLAAPPLKTVDFVVVGGGTGGLSAATVLSESGHSVLVVESGNERSDGQSLPTLIERPRVDMLWSELWKKDMSPWTWQTAISTPAGDSNRLIAGRVVGGSGALNLMALYTGSRASFDAWPPGWRHDDVHDEYEAMLKSWPRFAQTGTQLGRFAMINASHECTEIDSTINLCPQLELSSPNDIVTTVGVMGRATVAIGKCAALLSDAKRKKTLATIGATRRCRADAYNVLYLPQEARSRGTLSILTRNTVKRIVWQHDIDAELVSGEPRTERQGRPRAIGVALRSQVDAGGTMYVRARRAVVVAAGFAGTPAVLWRSGVGQTASLVASGITPVVDQPDLGRHLTDHALGSIACTLVKPGMLDDRVGSLYMVGVTSDDRVALNVLVL
jgi:hypothetical protein